LQAAVVDRRGVDGGLAGDNLRAPVIDCVVGGIRTGFHVFDALGTRCPTAAGHHDVAHLDHIGPIGDPDVVEAARILVRADPPGRTVRVTSRCRRICWPLWIASRFARDIPARACGRKRCANGRGATKAPPDGAGLRLLVRSIE
jgi:hypothetical protein